MGAALALAGALRFASLSDETTTSIKSLLFARPWHRPPLAPLLTHSIPLPPSQLGLLAGLLTVGITGLLAKPALGHRGQLVASLLAALCPALVLSGSRWGYASLVIPLTAMVALALLRSISRPDVPATGLLAGSTALLLLSDWPAWAPVLAWYAWLRFFTPGWLFGGRSLPARRGLAYGMVAALGVVGLAIWDGADPRKAMSADKFPLGPEAAEALLNGVSGLWLGRSGNWALPSKVALAVALAALVVLGYRRACGRGEQRWGTILLVGSAGAFLPALAIHPWIPIAADKHLWYMTPLVICLASAALWPRSYEPAATEGIHWGAVDPDG